jgi:hypothetical protein
MDVIAEKLEGFQFNEDDYRVWNSVPKVEPKDWLAFYIAIRWISNREKNKMFGFTLPLALPAAQNLLRLLDAVYTIAYDDSSYSKKSFIKSWVTTFLAPSIKQLPLEFSKNDPDAFSNDSKRLRKNHIDIIAAFRFNGFGYISNKSWIDSGWMDAYEKSANTEWKLVQCIRYGHLFLFPFLDEHFSLKKFTDDGFKFQTIVYSKITKEILEDDKDGKTANEKIKEMIQATNGTKKIKYYFFAGLNY